VGGLIGHCVSPQPWREIDAHALTKYPRMKSPQNMPIRCKTESPRDKMLSPDKIFAGD